MKLLAHKQRIVTGLALAGALLACLIIGGWPLRILALVAALLALHEFYAMFWPGKKYLLLKLIGLILGAGVFLLPALSPSFLPETSRFLPQNTAILPENYRSSATPPQVITESLSAESTSPKSTQILPQPTSPKSPSLESTDSSSKSEKSSSESTHNSASVMSDPSTPVSPAPASPAPAAPVQNASTPSSATSPAPERSSPKAVQGSSASPSQPAQSLLQWVQSLPQASPAIFPILAFFVATLSFLFRFGFGNTDAQIGDAAPLPLGILYIPLALNLTFALAPIEQALVMLAAIGTDTGGYYAGCHFGRHKIWPSVSPKKSWEGSFGGMVLCVLLCATIGPIAFAKGLGTPNLSIPAWIALGVVLNLAAQFGDFFESALKRSLNVKDSGTTLPGHGGVLDRIDSLLFVLPVYCLARAIAG